MKRALNQLPPDQRTFEGLKETILGTLKIDRDVSVKNLVSGLIGALPRERQKEVFPLSLEQKRKILRDELTTEKIQTALTAKQKTSFGIQAPQDIDVVLNRLIQRDHDLEALFGLAAVELRKKPDATGPLLPDPGKIGPDDAVLLADKKATQAQLERMFEGPVANAGSDALTKPRQVLAGAGFKETPPLASHTLTEIPVDIGWASSCAGGDCSTKNMFAYVNTPTGRRFFMDMGPEGARGYFDTQLVESFGKRYLLVNIIQGQSLSPEMVEQALRALYQRRHELGAEGLMLPTWDHLSSHTNYNALRDRLRSVVDGKPETHYVYLDNPLREALRPYVNDSGYYTQDSRNKAVIVDFEGAHPRYEVRSTLTKAPQFPFRNVELMGKGESFLIAFEIEEVAGNPEVARRFLEAQNISTEEYKSLKPILENQQRLPTREYFEKVAAALQKYGYAFDTKFKKNSIHSLYPGLLRCPDAWTPEWRKKSLNAAHVLLKRQGTYGLVAESTVSPSASEFRLAALPEEHASLIKDLEGKYLERRAAGGILVSFNSDYERVLPALFGLARESGGLDEALNEIFREANTRDPAGFKKAVIASLHSEHDWIQRGAMTAIEKTGVGGPEILQAVESLQHGVARSHDAYLHSLGLSQHLRTQCINDALGSH